MRESIDFEKGRVLDGPEEVIEEEEVKEMREECLKVNKMKIYDDVLDMLANLKFVGPS